MNPDPSNKPSQAEQSPAELSQDPSTGKSDEIVNNSEEELLVRPDEIKTALYASGYLLEGRIGRILESKGFFVELGSFRTDPRDEGKSIEIDVWGGRLGDAANGCDRQTFSEPEDRFLAHVVRWWAHHFRSAPKSPFTRQRADIGFDSIEPLRPR